jgi:hypothetical protein
MSALTLDLTISGTIGKFTVEPLVVQYQVSSQDAASGPKEVSVPAAAAAGSISVCLEPMATQNLLLLCTDEEVTYRLNGDGVDRTIKPNGFAIHPGNPVVTQLDFGGNGTTAAKVSVFQLGLPGTPTSTVGGALIVEPEQTAIAAQTIFNLTQAPTNPAAVLVFRDGVLDPLGEWAVVGTVATFTPGVAFAGGERVQFVF